MPKKPKITKIDPMTGLSSSAFVEVLYESKVVVHTSSGLHESTKLVSIFGAGQYQLPTAISPLVKVKVLNGSATITLENDPPGQKPKVLKFKTGDEEIFDFIYVRVKFEVAEKATQVLLEMRQPTAGMAVIDKDQFPH